MSEDTVRVIGPTPSGFSEMLGAIVRGNLQRHPERVELLEGRPGVVRILASDANVTVTLELRDGTLRIYSGTLTAPPDVEIIADSETLVSFSAVPRLGPIPHPLKGPGRVALAKALRGEIRIRGVVRGRRLLDRMRGLLTTDPS